MPRENQTAAKARSVRIPLDYLRRKNPLDRWKRLLALLAILAAVVYVAWGALGPGSNRHYSPGPLAAAHAMWENRCDVCHQNFVPVSSDAWTDNPHAADQLCKNCHQGAEHSPNQIAAEVASCAACHRDHHGINNDLSRVADSACTVCHANIAKHFDESVHKQWAVTKLANVTNFVSEHPDFTSPKHDPAQIKFSHSRHMRPGLTLGLGPMLLSDLSPTDRERYRQVGQTDSDLVTLNCASCHQLDRGAVAAAAQTKPGDEMAVMAAGPVRPSGDYMLPITYEQNCKACHQLSYVGRTNLSVNPSDTSATADAKQSSTANGARYAAVQSNDLVPHGWSDEKLRRYVQQVLDMKFISESDRTLQSMPLADALQQPLEKWRLPNRPPKSDEPTQTVGEYLKGELQVAVKNLRLLCTECHQMSPEADSLGVQPVSSHPAWLEHASFSHAAHRAVSCQSCHVGAFPKDLPAEPTPLATLDSEVYIPGRSTCLECHSPPKGEGATATGGARFDCAECHRYHHGDSPWQGLGDPTRGAAQRVTIPEFIHGQPPEGISSPTK